MRLEAKDELVAITGASGFLGRYVARWLCERGRIVRAITRSPFREVHPNLAVGQVPSDPDEGALRKAFSRARHVIHLAGRAHDLREPVPDALAIFRAANVELTRRALRAAAAAGAETFLYASSVKAMGERTTVPWTEMMPAHPMDPYGQSKLEAEALVAAEGDRLGFRTVIIRFPAIYGPGMLANMLRLFAAVARGVPLPLGAIHNRRSLLFAGNAAAVLDLAMTRPDTGSGLFLVSDGHDVSTPELVRAIARAMGRRPRLIPVPPALFRLAGRVGDVLPPRLGWPISSNRARRLMDSLQVDVSRVREILGFVPPHTLEQGMLETAVWYRETHGEESVL